MTISAMLALATGLPTITTRHSGFPDQVVDGKNGFMVPESDYKALAEKILYLMEHPELWPEMGRFGREHMTKKYDKKVITDRQIAFYEEVLSDTGEYSGTR